MDKKNKNEKKQIKKTAQRNGYLKRQLCSRLGDFGLTIQHNGTLRFLEHIVLHTYGMESFV